jgi:hypothetical protein
VAEDVLAIADAYGLKKFAVVGRSGGGPHALACAALLPERTTRAAVLVGIAPHGADGLDWFDGMAHSNVLEFTAAANGYENIVAHTKAVAEEVRANPASLIARLQTELPDSDRRVVADHGIRSMLIETYAEALRSSDYGWIDDALAFCSPWGFDPATVGVPVLLWHGASDVFSPASHARWLADRIPSAAVVVQEGRRAGQGVTPDRLSPTTPTRIRPIDTSLVADTVSPRMAIPIAAVPAAPMPVHTAYAGPTSSRRRARLSRPKLISAQAAKPMVGHRWVKCWLCLSRTANPVSNSPAATMRNHAMADPVFPGRVRRPAAGRSPAAFSGR